MRGATFEAAQSTASHPRPASSPSKSKPRCWVSILWGRGYGLAPRAGAQRSRRRKAPPLTPRHGGPGKAPRALPGRRRSSGVNELSRNGGANDTKHARRTSPSGANPLRWALPRLRRGCTDECLWAALAIIPRRCAAINERWAAGACHCGTSGTVPCDGDEDAAHLAGAGTCLSVLSRQLNLNTGHSYSLSFFPLSHIIVQPTGIGEKF